MSTTYKKFEQPEAPGTDRYIKGAKLIDVVGEKVISNAVVHITGRKITAVGTDQEVRIPEGADVIDCGGLTLMPGLIDCHLHTMMFNCLTFHNYRVAQWEITPELQQMYGLFHAQLCFDMGFTTLRDLGLASSRGLLTGHLCAIRDAINAGVVEGPRMLIGGFTSITGSHLDLINPRAMQRFGFQTADGPWELRKLARQNLLVGCDVVKTCATGGGGTDKEEPDIRNMTQEEIDAIVDEAHAFHKIAAVHCFTPNGQNMALKAGADTIEHMVFSDQETADKIALSNAYMTPTLLHRTDHAIEMRRMQGTSMFVINKMKSLQSSCFETFQRMHKTGVKIAMGTDLGFDPEMGTNAKELAIYVDLGMSAMEAIQSATINGARAVKLESSIGSLEVGKFADLIAVDGDPMKAISCLQEKKNIQLVMKEGRVFADRRPGHNTKSVVSVSPGDWKKIDYL
ncbi:MAG: amidohydrolase family protein [Burkholderiaceae bacterium]|jgi:imidazolonepropionase-like amidohydrolase|nr:amidohydrolase family protein [Burkholderiaceae bacterium]